MSENAPPAVALSPSMVEALQADLAAVAEHTLTAITEEVVEYQRLEPRIRHDVAEAVRSALATFLRLATQPSWDAEAAPLRSAVAAAYELGSLEARTGRTVDALLAAYRVGARVSWREWSAFVVERQLPGQALARFAEMLFAYIDQLSAASVAGYGDQVATTGRVRERYRERLARALLDGAEHHVLTTAAARADWSPPETLTAVLLEHAHVRAVIAGWPSETLVASDLQPGGDEDVLLVPDVHADAARRAVLSSLRGRRAVVGPARPWHAARASYLRAVRADGLDHGDRPMDTEAHLSQIVLTADGEALDDLRAEVLAPLAGLRPNTAERLAETLRAWLLHHGRRDEVAAHLQVHPQTVRYRVDQLRTLYGERLVDPEQRATMLVALLVERTPRPRRAPLAAGRALPDSAAWLL
jgi:hypothetical protein